MAVLAQHISAMLKNEFIPALAALKRNENCGKREEGLLDWL
jgi:hypothetical protein